MVRIKGGVTAPRGFLASGTRAGIKKSGRPDLALLYSEVPAIAAGAFTTNRFAASPVKISKLHLKNKTHRAIIVNSGNANCANGAAGDKDAFLTARFISETLALDTREVLVASTGIIGNRLPIENIRVNIPALIGELSEHGSGSFARAIMTTDTRKKELAVKVRIGKATVTLGGACKGVGMIYPDLKTERHATMLCFITTDAAITKKMLEQAADKSLAESFHMISVDGDMSTNDTCFILANGLAGNKMITAKTAGYGAFLRALKYLMKELAREMVMDGEGATKLVEIEVKGAAAENDARTIARKISTSNLFKCCVYGEDPNWGRIAASAGASGVDFDPNRTDIYLGSIKVMSNGQSIDHDKRKTRELFRKKMIPVTVDLKSGGYSAIALTCDLSHSYVDINAEYST